MNFTVYPDTWVRDLPLLDFGPAAYIANRATLGTNMPQRKGTILVGPIVVGANSYVGHLTMVAPGVRIGNNVEIGVGCAIGLNTEIRDGARIGPTCGLEHGITIGERASIGGMSLICTKAVVEAKVVVANGSSIRSRSVVSLESRVPSMFEARISSRQSSSSIATDQWKNTLDPTAGHAHKRYKPGTGMRSGGSKQAIPETIGRSETRELES
jgi:acetyltransferase-like isoleucine patch superfamily enzyme